ncbi:MAG TPA: MerC domain-containing protein [Microscillaceae bacterium]|nr:MerC domain-containing protein [Microscillaceae bacterium]
MFNLQFIQRPRKSDLVGASASTLCLIHCVATPFLFVAEASVAHHHHGHGHGHTPLWWGLIDIFFIIISFVAVYFSAKTTSKNWVKYALFASWAFLTFIILNEKLEGIHLAEEWVYLPALSLVGLHLYNRRYCQCEDDGCEVPDKKVA